MFLIFKQIYESSPKISKCESGAYVKCNLVTVWRGVCYVTRLCGSKQRLEVSTPGDTMERGPQEWLSIGQVVIVLARQLAFAMLHALHLNSARLFPSNILRINSDSQKKHLQRAYKRLIKEEELSSQIRTHRFPHAVVVKKFPDSLNYMWLLSTALWRMIYFGVIVETCRQPGMTKTGCVMTARGLQCTTAAVHPWSHDQLLPITSLPPSAFKMGCVLFMTLCVSSLSPLLWVAQARCQAGPQ